MPIPTAITEKLGSVGKALGPAAIIGSGIWDYNTRRSEGQGMIRAGVGSFGSAALGALLPMRTYFALTLGVPLVRAAAQNIYEGATRQDNIIRLATTPFSHRFEHTQITSRAQQLGLQAIGSSWAHSRMGSEAAAMAARYGRR